jgi:hypothetical protein
VLRLLVIANDVPISPILVTLTMEALRSSEALVLTSTIRRNIPEDGILHTRQTVILRLSITAVEYMRNQQ